MQGPASAFAVLGLEPGADRAAIEEAYRRLIKQHHPDRSGGNAARAAEINRAYFELRRRQPVPVVEPTLPPRPRRATARNSRRRRRKRSTSRRLWVAAAASAALIMLLQSDGLLEAAPQWDGVLSGEHVPAQGQRSVPRSGVMDEPLSDAAIAAAVRDAAKLARRGDWDELANRSRECHRQMRADPRVRQLDRCVALDAAAIALDEAIAERSAGPFSASAVTSRQMTAASLLSSDYLAIEERLDRIRVRVELTLLPAATRSARSKSALEAGTGRTERN